MTLSDYDAKVKPHLDLIEAGANMALRHAKAIPLKLWFTTHAEDELAEACEVLESALAKIKSAQATYQSKAVEHA